MKGFSTQELMDVHAACIYRANSLIADQLYVLNALRTAGGITEENAVNVNWLTNTAQSLKEIAGCMEIASKLLELVSKEDNL